MTRQRSHANASPARTNHESSPCWVALRSALRIIPDRIAPGWPLQARRVRLMWFVLGCLREEGAWAPASEADAHVWVGGENSIGKLPKFPKRFWPKRFWPKPVLDHAVARHALLRSDGLGRCLIHDLQHHSFNFFGHTPELRGMRHFDRRRGPDGGQRDAGAFTID